MINIRGVVCWGGLLGLVLSFQAESVFAEARLGKLRESFDQRFNTLKSKCVSNGRLRPALRSRSTRLSSQNPNSTKNKDNFSCVIAFKELEAEASTAVHSIPGTCSHSGPCITPNNLEKEASLPEEIRRSAVADKESTEAESPNGESKDAGNKDNACRIDPELACESKRHFNQGILEIQSLLGAKTRARGFSFSQDNAYQNFLNTYERHKQDYLNVVGEFAKGCGYHIPEGYENFCASEKELIRGKSKMDFLAQARNIRDVDALTLPKEFKEGFPMGSGIQTLGGWEDFVRVQIGDQACWVSSQKIQQIRNLVSELHDSLDSSISLVDQLLTERLPAVVENQELATDPILKECRGHKFFDCLVELKLIDRENVRSFEDNYRSVGVSLKKLKAKIASAQPFEVQAQIGKWITENSEPMINYLGQKARYIRMMDHLSFNSFASQEIQTIYELSVLSSRDDTKQLKGDLKKNLDATSILSKLNSLTQELEKKGLGDREQFQATMKKIEAGTLKIEETTPFPTELDPVGYGIHLKNIATQEAQLRKKVTNPKKSSFFTKRAGANETQQENEATKRRDLRKLYQDLEKELNRKEPRTENLSQLWTEVRKLLSFGERGYKAKEKLLTSKLADKNVVFGEVEKQQHLPEKKDGVKPSKILPETTAH